jgi:hypothetical protein
VPKDDSGYGFARRTTGNFRPDADICSLSRDAAALRPHVGHRGRLRSFLKADLAGGRRCAGTGYFILCANGGNTFKIGD